MIFINVYVCIYFRQRIRFAKSDAMMMPNPQQPARERVLNDLKMLIFPNIAHLVKRISFFRLNNAGSVKRQDLI